MLKLLCNICLFSAFLALSGCYLTPKTPQKLLYLTETDKHGDCVSSGIYTEKSHSEVISDQQSCIEHHPHDAISRDACIQNLSAIKTVRSLIDYCGAEGSPYFIGINGVTYALEKLGPRNQQHPYMTGQFIGKGLTVKVTNLGLITKTYQDDSSQDEDNIEQIKFNVLINIMLDDVEASFKGMLDEGI